MALSWTQDRLGPMCRYAEDCALVMCAISRPDGRDLSVQDLPFNWNATLDVSRMRVGYLEEAFEESDDPVVRRLNRQTLADLKSLGVTVTPIEIPEWSITVTAHSVEMAVFFDELLRSGRADLLGRQTRADGLRSARLIPAVEYLQSQRARTMMMMRLAEATAGVDVYLVPRGRRRPPPEGGDATPPPDPPPYSASRNASNMTNYACHPAVAVPNGFNEDGTPTSMTFYAQPFKESQLLAVARAYQDVSGHHPETSGSRQRRRGGRTMMRSGHQIREHTMHRATYRHRLHRATSLLERRPRQAWTLLLVVGVALFVAACGSGGPTSGLTPDRILHNGQIITMDGDSRVAQALAYREGPAGSEILAVGTDREIMALRGPDTRVTDLEGHAVIPGLIDAHLHFSLLGIEAEFEADLRYAMSTQGIVDLVRRRSPSASPRAQACGSRARGGTSTNTRRRSPAGSSTRSRRRTRHGWIASIVEWPSTRPPSR